MNLELELQQQELTGYEVVLHTTLSHEETMEMIVSDAYPDILTVLDTAGTVFLDKKVCEMGSVSLSGQVKCSVLYRPESGAALQAMEVELPFALSAQEERIGVGAQCTAAVRLARVETRMLNPRKVLIRGEIVGDVTLYRAAPFRYCDDIPNRQDNGVEQRLSEHQGCFVREVAERPFHFADTLNLPGSKPPVDKVLRSCVRLFATEEKLLGSKLVFKGSAAIQLLYLSTEGRMTQAEFDLPFSQMVEVSAGSGAFCQLQLCLVGCEVDVADNDGRQLTMELDALAQAVLRETHVLRMVSDAYSIQCAAPAQFAQVNLPCLRGNVQRRISLRELLEAPAQAREVLSVRLCLSALSCTHRERILELSGEARCCVVFTDTEGEPLSVSQTFPVRMEAECPDSCRCFVQLLREDTAAMVTAGGLELRSDLDFQLLLMGEESVSVLTALQLDTEQPLDFEGKPSIVLRQLRPGETLWDMAKAYSTTCTEILRANELEEGSGTGQLLLIPRKR